MEMFAHVDRTHPNNKVLYILRRGKEDGLALLVTMVPNLTPENWVRFSPTRRHRGKLLMISDGELLYNGDI